MDDDKQLCALVIERLKAAAFVLEAVQTEFAAWNARSLETTFW